MFHNTDGLLSYLSLLHLMGCVDYRFTGLGESVFADTVSNVAVFRTEEIVKSLDCSISQEVVQHRKQLWKVSDILLRMNYFAD